MFDLKNLRELVSDQVFSHYNFAFSVDHVTPWIHGDNYTERVIYSSDKKQVPPFRLEFYGETAQPDALSAVWDSGELGELTLPLSECMNRSVFNGAPDMIWYHGTPSRFERFDSRFIGIGNDQLGSGFYFTSSRTTAEAYAHKDDNEDGYLVSAHLSITKPLHAGDCLHIDEIKKIIKASPIFDDQIHNFGDPSMVPISRILHEAASIYASMNGCDDVLTVLNSISNDFWPGHESQFLETVTQLTGYDGLYRISGDQVHAVVWNPEQIWILELELTCPGFFDPR